MDNSSVKLNVRNQFGKVAANYATSQIHASGADLQALVEAANLTGQESVLDLGTGPGHVAMLLAPKAATLTGIDLSVTMLQLAEQAAQDRQIENISFKTGDAEHLPFDDQQFDLVVSRFSGHHWPAPANVAKEIYRVLKPGGRVLIADIVNVQEFAVDTFLQSIEILRDPSHVRDYSICQWQQFLTAAGLQSEVVFESGCEIDFESWVQRMETPLNKVQVLRTMMNEASDEVVTALKIQTDGSFTEPIAIIQGTKTR